MAREGSVKLLHKAKKSKSDEFYTQYCDIQKEIEGNLEKRLFTKLRNEFGHPTPRT